MRKYAFKAALFCLTLLFGVVLGAYLESMSINGKRKSIDMLGDRYDMSGPVYITAYKNGRQVGYVNGFSHAIIRTPDVDSFIIAINP